MADEVKAQEEQEENEEKGMGIWHPGLTSFEDYDAMLVTVDMADKTREQTRVFMMLTDNVMHNPEIEDKGSAIVALAQEFSARVSSENASKDTFLKRIQRAVGLDDGGKQTDTNEALMFFKSADDPRWRWIARYSNNLKDRDNPPEILAGEAHHRFADRVAKGEVPPPELWLLHKPYLRVGKAEWVVAHNVASKSADSPPTVIAMAGGYIYEWASPVAEALSKAKGLGVSHGMPVDGIVRDEEDPSIIFDYNSQEITVLAMEKAANLYTSFYTLSKERSVMTDSDKRQLREWGVSDEMIEQIIQSNKTLGQVAEEMDLPRKSVTEVVEDEAVEETAAEETLEEEQVEEEAPAESVEEPADPSAQVVFSLEAQEEFAKGLVEALNKQVLEPMLEQIADQAARIEVLEKSLTEVGGAETEAKDEQMLKTRIWDSVIKSAIGAPETRIDGRSSLAQKKPAEADAQQSKSRVTRLVAGLTGE